MENYLTTKKAPKKKKSSFFLWCLDPK